MATLRTRLTVAYGFALIGGLIVFAVALWTVRVASGIDALGPTAIEQGDRVLEPLRAWVLNDHPLLEDQTRRRLAPPRVVRSRAASSPSSAASRATSSCTTGTGRSSTPRSDFASSPLEDRSAILATAKHLEPNGPGALVAVADPLFDGKMLLVARRDSTLLPDVTRVVVRRADHRRRARRRRASSARCSSCFPLILIAFIGVSYFVTGRALEPIDELMNEVEAITDGRSLHRRLPPISAARSCRASGIR